MTKLTRERARTLTSAFAGKRIVVLGDLMLDEFKVCDGTVGLPSAPGLGVRLSQELLEKYRFIPSSGERT